MRPALLSPLLLPLVALATANCSSEIYLRDGVTDGDTFYLAQQALTDSDPVLQSWVSYSLARSACQLQLGGRNPARATSFNCELSARRQLIESWSEKVTEDPRRKDRYLDQVAQIHRAGFLPEYVALNFRQRGWAVPRDLDPRSFKRWKASQLPDHRPETRLIGSWNYARKVGGAKRPAF
ncbi:MAG: hypothetical protein WD448_06830 [Woeseia sp.]